MELTLPTSIYFFVGVAPGILSLLVFATIFLNGAPHSIKIEGDHISVIEWQLIIPRKAQFSQKKLQMFRLGQPAFKGRFWGLFLFSGFLAGHIWTYAFDSIRNHGIMYYFTITQEIWNNTEVVGTINFGLQLFITVLILIIAPLLMVTFPRRECIMETAEGSVNFHYSSVKISGISTRMENATPDLIDFLHLFQEKMDLTPKSPPIDTTSSLSSLTQTSVPYTKLLMIGFSILAIAFTQYIPGYYVPDFMINFGIMTFLQFWMIGLLVLQYEWITKTNYCPFRYENENINALKIVRYNPIYGSMGWFFSSSNYQQISNTMRPIQSGEIVISTIFGYELLVTFFNVFIYAKYFFTQSLSILITLPICVLWGATLLFFYWTPVERTEFQPVSQREQKIGYIFPIERFSLYSFISKSTLRQDWQNWGEIFRRIKLIWKDDTFRKESRRTLLLFGIPIIWSVIWLVCYLFGWLPFFTYLFI
jgi:hypothetical protein